jgi:hypothetical protein
MKYVPFGRSEQIKLNALAESEMNALMGETQT